jgi:CHAT domain-containing protein
MVSFYRRAGYDSDGGGIASAWRRAQLEAMQAHPHPAFWAPFILTGAA